VYIELLNRDANYNEVSWLTEANRGCILGRSSTKQAIDREFEVLKSLIYMQFFTQFYKHY